MTRGFTVVEVLVALAILEVGLLGAAGTLLAAQRVLAAAERLHAAAQEAAHVADSLATAGAGGSGHRVAPWGALRWSGGGGGLRLTAEDPGGGVLLDWWLPGPAR